jgi:type III secretory pathway component EscS
MNQKQLANVLVKILGLSFCAHGVPAVIAAIIAGVISLIQAMHDGIHTGGVIP